jgi:hypothetical protein
VICSFDAGTKRQEEGGALQRTPASRGVTKRRQAAAFHIQRLPQPAGSSAILAISS